MPRVRCSGHASPDSALAHPCSSLHPQSPANDMTRPPSDHASTLRTDHSARPLRILITAGPTHEPIDRVRYIGNRSSGRMGIALAHAAASLGHEVTLALGPSALSPHALGSEHSADPAAAHSSQLRVLRFQTVTDLQALLREEAPKAHVLIMAAAVADYRPKAPPAGSGERPAKFRRADGPLTLELESTPDLIAEVAAARRAREASGQAEHQTLVAFALEPRDEMIEAAQRKLIRKDVDLVVANPLETMDSPTVEAVVIHRDGRQTPSPGIMLKNAFAAWFMELVLGARAS